MVGCFPGFCNFALQVYCQHDLICRNTVWTGLRVDTLKSVLHVFLLDILKMTADWGSFYGFFFPPDWAWPTLESESHLVMSDSLRPHGLYSHGILQARILDPRDRTQVSHIAGRLFTGWAKGKPKNTGVGSLSLLQQIFPTQESNWDLLHCRWILYQLNYEGSPTHPWR